MKAKNPRNWKNRTHFIHRILSEKFGGEWVKSDRHQQWRSKDHDFWVYRSGRWIKEEGRVQAVYRRFDTKEIVFESNGRKF